MHSGKVVAGLLAGIVSGVVVGILSGSAKIDLCRKGTPSVSP
jgi:ABC-type nitrate/sulfonate/bicarbonate transport system permease component